jgi:hypothetical protein
MQAAVGGLDGPGIYSVPSMSWEAMNNDAGKKATAESHRKGPNAIIIRGPTRRRWTI